MRNSVIAVTLLLFSILFTAAEAQQTKEQDGLSQQTTEAGSSWRNAIGEVVKADPSTNTLVLTINGKETTFSMPGRINTLNLKPGDKVSITYFRQGKGLRIWALKELSPDGVREQTELR